jgi:hypothetical protein
LLWASRFAPFLDKAADVRFRPIADIALVWNKRGMAADATDFDYASETVPLGALFVAADEPLLVYPSVASAERHLEAIDVESGVYQAAYGPNGEPYRIESDGNRVIIEPTGEPNRPEELRLLLLRYLEVIGRTPDATATVNELVATVWGVERDFWQKHDPYSDRFARRIPTWGCIAFSAVVVAVFYIFFR